MMIPVVVAGVAMMMFAVGISSASSSESSESHSPPTPPDGGANLQFARNTTPLGLVAVPELLDTILHSGSLTDLAQNLSELDALMLASNAPLQRATAWVLTAELPNFGPEPQHARDSPRLLSWDDRYLLIFDIDVPPTIGRYRIVLRMDQG